MNDQNSLNNTNLNELISYSEGGILSKVITKTDKQNITLFSMAAGTSMSEHTSTKEGFVYVVEGQGIFNLEGQDIEMKPGAYIFMNSNAKHSLQAKENTSFLLVLAN
jgi:quercetin dioxygenase-like cupin family protein